MKRNRIRVCALLLSALLILSGCVGAPGAPTEERGLSLPEPASDSPLGTAPASGTERTTEAAPQTEPASSDLETGPAPSDPETEPAAPESTEPVTELDPSETDALPETEALIPVPALVGTVWDESLRDAWPELRFTVTEETSDEYAAGLVTDQSPAPEEPVAPGTEIRLCVSLGARTEPMPELRGMTWEQAAALLETLGLELTVLREMAWDPEIPENCVIWTEPEAGRQLSKSQVVLLTVSLGPELVSVPDVTGASLEQARDLLSGNGLRCDVQEDYSTDVPAGSVVSQTPAAGEQAPADSAVRLVISLGPKLVRVPDLRGDSQDYAVSRLEGLGLHAQIESEYSDWVKTGRVIRQDPAPDGELPPDGTVVLVLSLGPENAPDEPTEPTDPEPTEPRPTEPEPTEPGPAEPGTGSAPTLTLLGGSTVEINAGTSYSEPGWTAVDEADGDLSGRVKVSGSVNVYHAGEYQLTYTVTNSSSRTAQAVRTVRVVPIRQPEQVNPGSKTIYLTFDDGPSKYTQQLLDVLAQYNVKVTFFVVNTGYRNLIAAEAAAGHSIGVHSLTHDYNTIYASEEAYFADLNAMNDIIQAQTGSRTTMIRFPGGSSNRVSSFNPGIMTRLTQAVTDAGYQYYDWNAQSGDAGLTTDTNECYQNVVDGVKNRDVSVVLMHDSKGYSVAAVERILIWGIENGYTFLPLTPSSPKAHHHLNN